MVSPSKIFKSSNRELKVGNICSKKDGFNTQGASKPKSSSSSSVAKSTLFLTNTKFYLDIRNRTQLAKVESTLKSYGAKIEVFFSKEIKIVVTDKEWIGNSQSPSASISPLTTPSPSFNQDQRFVVPRSRASAMLEKVSRQPVSAYSSPLELAQKWRIPVLPIPSLWKWLAKVEEAFLTKLNEKKKQRELLEGKIVVNAGNSPFIKIESLVSPNTPQFEELGAWPKLHLDGILGQCPFRSPTPPDSDEPIKEEQENFFEVKNKVAVEFVKYDTDFRIKNSSKIGECEEESGQNDDPEAQNRNSLGLFRVFITCFFILINEKMNIVKMTRRPAKNNPENYEDDFGNYKDSANNLSPLCNGHAGRAITRQSSQELLKVQCNGLTTSHRNSKLLSPSGSDVLPLPTSRRSTRRASASWCGSTRELSQLSPTDSEIENIRRSDSSFEAHDPGLDSPGITLRPKGQLWLPIALIGTTAEENGNCIRKRYEYSNKLSENTKLSSESLEPIEEKTRDESEDNSIMPRISKESDSSLNSNYSQNEYQIKRGSEKRDTYCIITRNSRTKNEEVNGRSRESSVESHKSEQELPKSRTEGKKRSLSVCGNVSPSLKRSRTLSTNSVHLGTKKKKLSPEEKLLLDNKEYFKMEVFNTKLRSSGSLLNVNQNKEQEVNAENVEPFKEKIGKIIIKKIKMKGRKRRKSRWTKANVKREPDVNYATIILKSKKNNNVKINGIIKRKRQSELMKLCNEAESFMFGESSRQGSITTNSTESEHEDSPKKKNNLNTLKINSHEENSVDSNLESEGKTRRKRRSHAEAFIHDNLDYYKFETPGSRLRYQGTFLDVKSEDRDFIYTLKQKKEKRLSTEQNKKNELLERFQISLELKEKFEIQEKKRNLIPSEEVEKILFSFERVPVDEPWYEVYKRQDEGMENYYPLLSNPDDQPFLLPYELPKPNYSKVNSISEYYKRRRKNLVQLLNHPRKSPRCHASTLAILSSLKKRKRRSGTNISMNAMLAETPSVNANVHDGKNEGKLLEVEQKEEENEEILNFLYSEDLNEETDDVMLEPFSDSECKPKRKNSDSGKSVKSDDEEGKSIKTCSRNRKTSKLESQSGLENTNEEERLFLLQSIKPDSFKDTVIEIRKKSGLNVSISTVLENFKNCKSMDDPEGDFMFEGSSHNRKKKKARKINKTGWDTRKSRRKAGNKTSEVKEVGSEEVAVKPKRIKIKVKSRPGGINTENIITSSKRRTKKGDVGVEGKPLLRSHLEVDRVASLRRCSQDSESRSSSLDSRDFPPCVLRVKKISETCLKPFRLRGSNAKYNLQKRRLVLRRKKKRVVDYAWSSRRSR